MAQPWRGVFAIPPTPFTETGALDLDSLRREVEFCVAAGAHGVVAPVNASEFWTLTDDERKAVAETIVQAAAGQIPAVIGVAGGAAEGAVMFAKHAQEVGADAVIAMPPYVRVASPAAVYDYYQKLSAAIEIPIFIQNHDAPAGTRLSPEFVARLINELPHVEYVKEETYPPGHAISAELRLAGPRLKGVMGGIAGRYLIDEYRRGACGTMPACEAADIHAQLWDALEAHEDSKAREIFNRLLPLLNIESMYGAALYKEVLRRRGVIATTYLRSHAGNPLDESDQQEVTAILADLSDLFRVAPPR
jgi:4-hydroxy-tetrahydrodipicolinate synthase